MFPLVGHAPGKLGLLFAEDLPQLERSGNNGV